MDKNDIIAKISQLRTKAGLSARDLSLRIGKNSAYISRLESKNDSFEPSVSALLEIIEACGSTPLEFFYYNSYTQEKDRQIINLLEKAKPEVKDAVIKILENLQPLSYIYQAFNQ